MMGRLAVVALLAGVLLLNTCCIAQVLSSDVCKTTTISSNISSNSSNSS